MTLLFPRQAEQFQSTSRSSGTKHTNAASCSVAPIDRTVSENCTIPNPIQFLWLGRRTVAAAGRTIPKHLSLKQGCRGAEALPEAQGPNAAEAQKSKGRKSRKHTDRTPRKHLKTKTHKPKAGAPAGGNSAGAPAGAPAGSNSGAPAGTRGATIRTRPRRQPVYQLEAPSRTPYCSRCWGE